MARRSGDGGPPMKVCVLGGGPAGLYAALLLKKDHPAWDVGLIERNPPDATYGWGVVFSDRTLVGLREADVRTFTEITDAFVLWEAIDIHIHDQLVRCDGHAFAGIGRRRLLGILQDRCRDLGVELTFEVDVAGTDDQRISDADLLIAADGVNSRIREQHASAFRPRVVEGRSRYIWFGAERTYDAFTFLFRQTVHGLFQVHAYPYDATMSTFIVECTEQTWRSAGLDAAGEAQSIAFCQELFADHLGTRRLLSNRSSWLTFPTLTTRSWSHGNIVLLGDAAHTAHFSIGSGTKLALEDAIGLAQAFEQFDDVPRALRQYELARRPRVEATQRAAEESRAYFEEIGRYHTFPPLQFAFHLLTRSGRITWDNLRQRDPYFVADVERVFSAAVCVPDEPVAARALLVAPPPAFTPLRLREVRLTNRLVVQPAPVYDATGGTPSVAQGDEHAKSALSGAGLTLTQAVAVSEFGRITPGCPGMYSEAHAAQWSDVVATSRDRSNAAFGVRLSHAGRRGATQSRDRAAGRPLADGGWPLLAPSAEPWGRHSTTPIAMSESDIACVIEHFARAAGYADAAGFDLLALDLAHGYLLGSFLSPLANRRGDAWGGDRQRRMRLPLEVWSAVRDIWPAGKPLAAFVSADDCAPGGAGIEDAVALALALRAVGCDLLIVTAGDASERSTPDHGYDAFARYCDVLRNESGLPAMSTAYMTTSNQANTLLAGGRADLCVFQPRPRRGN